MGVNQGILISGNGMIIKAEECRLERGLRLLHVAGGPAPVGAGLGDLRVTGVPRSC